MSPSLGPDWHVSHAYVPGQTDRHPEGFLDGLKTQIDLQSLDTSIAWKAGLHFLQNGYYWEAHEVLEAVWMAAPENSPEKIFVQAVIQRANAELKMRMERPRAAARLFSISETLFGEAFSRRQGSVMGWSRDQLDQLAVLPGNPSSHR
ncbi:MAG: DUF309 domain-containing protein [Stappiaceae bacterium]